MSTFAPRPLQLDQHFGSHEGTSLRFVERLNFPMPAPDRTPQLLDYYIEASAADPATRESMWQDLPGGNDRTAVTELKRGLLQSYPDHSGYDVVTGRRRLQALVRSAPSDVAIVAKVRLAEMTPSLECTTEVEDLRQRLAKITDIERQLNQGKQH